MDFECSTCKFFDIDIKDDPCFTCIDSTYMKYYEKKEYSLSPETNKLTMIKQEFAIASRNLKEYEKTKGKDYSKRHGELLLQLEDVKNRFKSIVFELWVSDKIDFIKKVGKDGRTYFV